MFRKTTKGNFKVPRKCPLRYAGPYKTYYHLTSHWSHRCGVASGYVKVPSSYMKIHYIEMWPIWIKEAGDSAAKAFASCSLKYASAYMKAIRDAANRRCR